MTDYVFYTRAGCHLCEQAQALLDIACEATGASYHAIDIDRDEEALQKYMYEIPVLERDGKPIVQGPFHLLLLLEALTD